MSVNRVNSQAPAFQTFETQQRGPAAQQQQPQVAQQNDPIARLNEALQALEQALQALSFGGNQNFGAQNVGQNLGFSDQSLGNQNFGFNDQLFQGGSQFDAQPMPDFSNWWQPPQPAPAPDQSFLDRKGGGGGVDNVDNGRPGNGNHFGNQNFGDQKSGGGRVDPGGANN